MWQVNREYIQGKMTIVGVRGSFQLDCIIRVEFARHTMPESTEQAVGVDTYRFADCSKSLQQLLPIT